jgi:serine/threonine protein phosphatase 1
VLATLVQTVRTLAIGDIHGCYKALTTLLSAVSPGTEDQFVFLGDYVDRGEDSRGVIELFLSDSRLKNAIFLRGNHEIMMMDSRADEIKSCNWQAFGGFETVLSYGAKVVEDWKGVIPGNHWAFLESTRPYHETSNHIFVHGSVHPDLELKEQPDWQLYWERFDSVQPHKSGKKIICGHTPQGGAKIADIGYAACIDTAAVFGGWLTCLDAASGSFWQANEGGQVQTGRL